VIAVLAFAGAGFALTQSNTFGAAAGGAAGSGAGAVAGYTVGTPSYTLLGSDPTKIQSFSFTLAGVTASTTVKAGLVAGTYANSCSLGSISGGSATVTCTYSAGSEPTVVTATNLTVVATN
jgi:hypothetical protein